MKTNKKPSSAKIAIILSTLAIVLSVVSVAYTALAQIALVKDEAFAFTLQQHQYLKIKFCYEHEIKPCTNRELDAWNKTHPDNMFDLNLDKKIELNR